jgi:hypothetical protein
MPGGKKLFGRRVPAYFGGLLLGLTAMIGIFQAKRAMMPNFHLVQENRGEATIAPGGSICLVYEEEEAGYFLAPGFPSRLTVSHKQPDGKFTPKLRLQYNELVEKRPEVGPLLEEGEYKLEVELFLCAEPGVADCARLELTESVRVQRNAPAAEARIPIGLAKLARAAVPAGAGR